MSRIIINADGISDVVAVDHVLSCIKDGKISKGFYGRQYCFLTSQYGVMTACTLSKTGTFTFRVYPDPLLRHDVTPSAETV
jgi:hypothetical protein